MVFFTAIYQEARPDRLEGLLGTIRQSLAGARTLHPGRRTTRLFQRIGQPTQLVSISEWSDEDAFEQFRSWPVFVEAATAAGPIPRIEPLQPLRRFERMDRRAALASCVTITAPAATADAVQELLLGEMHAPVKSMSGLVSREVYRLRALPSRFLIVRSWTSLADLDRFRAVDVPQLDRIHGQLGATVERFTGALAAEFSLVHP
jgi:quinol monooxygenase YgiN